MRAGQVRPNFGCGSPAQCATLEHAARAAFAGLHAFAERRGGCIAGGVMTKLRLLLFVPLVACAETNDVVIQLAPEVISSLDGTLSVHTIVLADRSPMAEETVDLAVEYTDRNGMAHPIAPVSGVTDDKGVFDAELTGLTWDGVGTVTATVAGGAAEASATFAVLDRTPPVVTITPPTASQVRAQQDITIQVHITDEIGVSQVFFEWSGQNQQGRDRSSVIASGSTDATVSFDLRVPDQIGSMVTLYALGADLSGNQAAAPPITVTVVAP
jgi:hypothetical protein